MSQRHCANVTILGRRRPSRRRDPDRSTARPRRRPPVHRPAVDRSQSCCAAPFPALRQEIAGDYRHAGGGGFGNTMPKPRHPSGAARCTAWHVASTRRPVRGGREAKWNLPRLPVSVVVMPHSREGQRTQHLWDRRRQSPTRGSINARRRIDGERRDQGVWLCAAPTAIREHTTVGRSPGR